MRVDICVCMCMGVCERERVCGKRNGGFVWMYGVTFKLMSACLCGGGCWFDAH